MPFSAKVDFEGLDPARCYGYIQANLSCCEYLYVIEI